MFVNHVGTIVTVSLALYALVMGRVPCVGEPQAALDLGLDGSFFSSLLESDCDLFSLWPRPQGFQQTEQASDARSRSERSAVVSPMMSHQDAELAQLQSKRVSHKKWRCWCDGTFFPH
jgi:hypothetical protein